MIIFFIPIISPQHWCEGVEIPDCQDEQDQGGDYDARRRYVVHDPVKSGKRIQLLFGLNLWHMNPIIKVDKTDLRLHVRRSRDAAKNLLFRNNLEEAGGGHVVNPLIVAEGAAVPAGL